MMMMIVGSRGCFYFHPTNFFSGMDQCRTPLLDDRAGRSQGQYSALPPLFFRVGRGGFSTRASFFPESHPNPTPHTVRTVATVPVQYVQAPNEII
jgi:hypothetical protein